MISLHTFKTIIYQYKHLVIVSFIALVLDVPISYFAATKLNQKNQEPKNEEVLGTTVTQSPTPSPSPTPIATLLPSPTPRVVRSTPTPVVSPSPSPSPSQSSSSSDNNSTSSQLTPTPTPSPSPSPTPSPSPSPQTSVIEVKVDYAPISDRPSDSYSATFSENQTAWTVIQTAIGTENLQYIDYGGDLGVFITGINGVVPIGNNFWLFKINGEGASVGVSSYIVREGDKLEFAISSF